MSLTTLFSDIADAIRAKTGSSATIVANNFPSAIASIPAGSKMELASVSNLNNLFNSQGDSISNLLYVAPDFDTTGCTTMEYMFRGCTALVSVPAYKTSSVTNMSGMFINCDSLVTAPSFDTSSVTDFSSMFLGCTALENVPLYDTSSATTLVGTFASCEYLTNDSLNNILAMCAGVSSSYAVSKVLQYVIDLQYYDESTITGLSNYQAFIDAGWTIGDDT